MKNAEINNIRKQRYQNFKIGNKMDEINWDFEPVVLPFRGNIRNELEKYCNQR